MFVYFSFCFQILLNGACSFQQQNLSNMDVCFKSESLNIGQISVQMLQDLLDRNIQQVWRFLDKCRKSPIISSIQTIMLKRFFSRTTCVYCHAV